MTAIALPVILVKSSTTTEAKLHLTPEMQKTTSVIRRLKYIALKKLRAVGLDRCSSIVCWK